MKMLTSNYKKGYVGYSPQYLQTLGQKQESIASINGNVYDFTKYVAGGRRIIAPPGQTVPSDVNTNFMDPLVVTLFQQKPGQDVTQYWNDLPYDSDERARMLLCMQNLFFVGRVDTRNSTQCLFARYFILAISILLVTIITFKFFAALQFGRKNLPENLDKFIV
jgi:chitin synthase